MKPAAHYVYRNLHNQVWSVRLRGLVVDHSNYVWLRDARFVVSQPGRRRVVAEQRKNVHAFVAGERFAEFAIDGGRNMSNAGPAVEVTYRPYACPLFTSKGGPRAGELVSGAEFVLLRHETVTCWGIKYHEIPYG